MNQADLDTERRHDAIWRAFVQRPEINVSSGLIPVPPAATRLVGFQIAVNDSGVRLALASALDELKETGCLSPFPPDYWHITIVPPALLTAGEPNPPRLLAEPFAEEALARATETVKGYRPFEVRVKGLNTFKDVLVAVPYDCGHSIELHRRLRCALPELPERYLDGHDPLAHVSLAQYRSRERIDELASLLANSRDREFGAFRVAAIEMYVLQVTAGVPGGVTKYPIPFD